MSSLRHSCAPRRLLAVGAVVVLAACSADLPPNTSLSPAPPGSKPVAVRLVAGDSQSAIVGTELPVALAAAVVDADGRPIRGQIVNFHVTAGGGSVFAGASVTNDSGIARERWTLGTSTADSQRVEARAVDANSGAAIVYGTFKAIALPGAATAVVKLGGDAQTGAAGASLPESLTVRVTDKYGNPVPGESVTWSLGIGGDGLTSLNTVTASSGVARVGWSLGARLGGHTATAQRNGIAPVSFTATAKTPTSAVLTTTGSAQAGVVGTVLSDSLSATLKLPDGRPVVGAWVRWTGSGSVAPDSAQTNDAGIARARWTLPTTTGNATATATIDGLAAASYGAIATAGAPVSMTVVAGDRQSVTSEQPLGDSLTVKVVDQFGNPVPNVTVNWAVAGGGGSASPTSALTSALGTARTKWTVGTYGPQSMTASATGASSTTLRATFTSTAKLATAATLTKVSGNAQTGTVATTLHDSLVVVAKLANGDPVIGAWVRWTPWISSGSMSADSSQTDAAGMAKGRWIMATTSGNKGTVASVEGLETTFNATATPDAPAKLTIDGGDGQYAPPGTALPHLAHLLVTDRYGNLAANTTVNWDVTTGGGHVFPTSVQTGNSGVGITTWTLGSTGPQVLTATVTGVAAAVFHASNQPIAIVVDEPLAYSVGRPKLRVHASCGEVARCDSVVVEVNATNGTSNLPGGRAVAGGVFDDSISLASVEGKDAFLNVRVRGHLAGEQFSTQIPVYAMSSREIIVAAQVPGLILDVAADGAGVLSAGPNQVTRILFVRDSAGRHLLKIRTVATGTDALVSGDSGRVPGYGYLTPNGAMWVDYAEGGNIGTNRLREWNTSGLTNDYGSINSDKSLRVKGRYAIWSNGTTLTRRDFSGPTVIVSTSAGNDRNDVAANGTVAYWGSDYRVRQFLSDTTIILSVGAGRDLYPVTDGTTVVYQKQNVGGSGPSFELWYGGASGVRQLRAVAQGTYLTNRGYVAWLEPDVNGELHPFEYIFGQSSPPPTTSSTNLGPSGRIESLGPNGQTILSTSTARSVLGRPLGGPVGRAFFIGSTAYIIVGRDVMVAP